MDWGPPGSVITVEQFSALWFRQLFRFPYTVNLSCPSRRTVAVLARSRRLVNQYLLGAIAKVKLHQLTAPHLITVYGRMSDAGVTYADIQYVHEVLHKGFIDAERHGVVHGVVTNAVLIPSSDHGADILDRTTIALSSGHLLQLRCTGRVGADRIFAVLVQNISLPSVRLCQEVGGVSWQCTNCREHFHGSHAKYRLFAHLFANYYYDRMPPSPDVPLISAPARGLGPQPVSSSLRPARYTLRPSAG